MEPPRHFRASYCQKSARHLWENNEIISVSPFLCKSKNQSCLLDDPNARWRQRRLKRSLHSARKWKSSSSIHIQHQNEKFYFLFVGTKRSALSFSRRKETSKKHFACLKSALNMITSLSEKKSGHHTHCLVHHIACQLCWYSGRAMSIFIWLMTSLDIWGDVLWRVWSVSLIQFSWFPNLEGGGIVPLGTNGTL